MNLKSLTLHGFKSFAQRTTLEFSSGVAAVVGPNGSGKSNISDAIRWVLGEQSIRLLRGSRLEDVIFAGSDSKKAVGMAEVSVTFDNSAKLIPVEYAEVTVSRRVYRSGESEFSINRNPCRLRDIQELFMDTGLGKGSLAIIGQGEVDLLLNARPEDRRAFLEEAAGISRYRVRKAEAMQRLSQTSDDLLRLGDIILEIESRLEPLKNDAAAAKTYQSIVEQLHHVEAALLWERKVRLTDRWEAAEARRRMIATERKQSRQRLDELEKQILGHEQQIDYLEKALDEARRSKEEARMAQAEARHRHDMASQKVAEEERQEGESTQRIRQIHHDFEVLQKQREQAQLSLLETEAEAKQCQVSIETLEQRIAAVRNQFQGHDAGIANERVQWQQMTENMVGLRARLQTLEESEIGLNERIDEHQRLKDGLEKELAAVTHRVAQVSATVTEMEHQLSQNNDAYSRADKALREFSARCLEEERRLNILTKSLHNVQARFRALADMDEAREGYHRGVKAVLDVASRRGWDLKGAVAELLHVPHHLEIAVEVALGAAQQFVIAQKDRDAQMAIEYLKQQRLGRATFLPLESLKPQRAHEDSVRRLEKITGAIGLAADLVDASSDLRPAVNYLLGRVAIAETLDAALQIGRTIRGFSRVVTLDGDIVVPGGAMTGGSRPNRLEGLVGRSRRLENLQNEMKDIEAKVNSAQEHLGAMRAQQEKLQQQLVRIDEQRRELDLKKLTAQRELQEVRFRQERSEKLVQNWHLERQQLSEQLERLMNDKHKCTLQLEEFEERKEEMTQMLTAREEEMGAARREEERLREELHELKISFAAIAQNQEHKRQDMARLEQEKRTIEKALQEEQNRLQAIRNEKSRAKEMIERALGEVQQATEVLERASQDEHRIARQREQVREKRHDLAEKTKVLQESLNTTQDDLTQAEVELDRLSRELERIEKELTNRAIVARPHGESDHEVALDELERKRRSLKAQLDSMGPINMNAIQEYEAVSKRYTFLSEQKDDLEQARQKLHEVIARIDHESRTKFDALFTAVKKEFSHVFTRLFRGGNARLELTDPDDPLESGVDIFVQPPGKKLQNLLALSGGERALAAIALLFAILSVRPSPFCVLDEIDAALDEHNLTRFRDLLKEFSVSTQFLIITHRQGTMESADSLFGVTMEDSGVSRLVALNLEDVKSA